MKCWIPLAMAALLVGHSKLLAEDPATVEKNPPLLLVELQMDRHEFFLGESIPVTYFVKNRGPISVPYGGGSVYPDLRMMSFMRCSATKVDGQGAPVGKPVAGWPLPMWTGGLVGNWKLKFGESHSVPLFATRYLRFDEPGTYKLRIENVDPYKGKVLRSFGETQISLKQPTPEQAREVYAKNKKAPREAWDSNSGRFLLNAADFETMHQPVYWPMLREFALKGDLDALPSLKRAESPEANEILIGALVAALDNDNWQFARDCFAQLKEFIVLPSSLPGDSERVDEVRLARLRNAWKTEFSLPLIRLAQRLTVEVETPNKNRTDEATQQILGDIATIYNKFGRPEDLPDSLRAFRKSIELANTMPLETHQYFRPRGSAYSFHFVVRGLLNRGAKLPMPPTNPAEAAAFALALQSQKDFRPAGWDAEVMKWLQSDEPYVAELFLDCCPEPIPQPVLDYLPKLLSRSYIDLQIAACHVAEKHPRPEFEEPLQRVLKTATDQYLRKFAVDAARANGLPAKYDRGAPFVSE